MTTIGPIESTGEQVRGLSVGSLGNLNTAGQELQGITSETAETRLAEIPSIQETRRNQIAGTIRQLQEEGKSNTLIAQTIENLVTELAGLSAEKLYLENKAKGINTETGDHFIAEQSRLWNEFGLEDPSTRRRGTR